MKPPAPLNYIRSFESAARHLSFTAAAQELGYTQAAISSHVRALEQYIGRQLFIRYPRSLKLTDMGEAFLPTLRQALAEIDNATEAIVAKGRNRTVVVSCPVSLAENWLAGVMVHFHEAHPGIEVVLQGTVWEDLDEQLTDLTISIRRFDDQPSSGTLLWDDELILVCSPKLVAGDALLRTSADVARYPWIQVLGRQECWQIMAEALHLGASERPRSLAANSTNVALELAAQGAGIVATQWSLAQIYLERGLLVEPLPVRRPSPWAYYLIENPLSKGSYCRAVREWIVSRAAANKVDPPRGTPAS